jgi:hypothetical protein
MSDRDPSAVSAAQRKCCACCDEGAEPGRCVFNGRRDDHAGPCEYCDPIGHAAWLAEPRPEVDNVPF